MLSYNRRLAWVVIPLAFWALFGITLAIGAGSRGNRPPPIHLQVGLPEGGLWIPGHLLEVRETAEMLTIKVGLRPGDHPPVDHDHDDLTVELTEVAGRPQGQPDIQVLGGEVHSTNGNRGAILAENYLVKYDRAHIQVIPRGPELTVERFRKGIDQYFRGGGRDRPGMRRGPGGEGGPPPPPDDGRQPRVRGPRPRRDS